MSLRSDIVDALQGEASISAIVGDRVTDIIHDYEDRQNTAPNQFVFPAISVRTVSEEEEDNLSGHDGYIVASFEIILFDTVKRKRIRSRSATIRANYETDVRAIDTLKSAVKTFLHSKANTVVGSYHIRKSHVSGSGDESLIETDNENIVAVTMNYEITCNEV